MNAGEALPDSGPSGTRTLWAYLAAFSILFPALLILLCEGGFQRLRFAGLLLPLPLLLAFHHRHRLPSWTRPVILAVAGAACLSTALYVSRNLIYWQMHAPREWDFLAFWYFGYAGASGMNFYELETFRQLTPFWNPGPESGFAQTILNVGYLYAPPSMFWMLPLGWLDIPKAVLYWYGVQSAALAAVFVLLKRLFLAEEGRWGWVTAAALIALYPPVTQTFFWAQTNFTALLAAVLFWKYRASAAGGAAIAVGMTVKNYFPAFLMFSVLRGHFRALGGFLFAALIVAGLSLLYFGPEICLSYFTERPPTRSPLDDLTYHTNQSLSAFFLRRGFQSVGGHPVFTWPYLACATAMTLATAWAIRRAPEADSDWALALTITLLLIFYPGAWEHYAAMSLPAIFLIWSRRSLFRGGTWTALLVLAGVFALTTYIQSLPAHLILWAVLLAFSPMLPWSSRLAASHPSRAVRIHAGSEASLRPG